MAIHRSARIEDLDGTFGWLLRVTAEDEANPIAVVRFGNGAITKVPFEMLAHHDDGGYQLKGRWTDYTRKSQDVADIPVIEERATVRVQPAPVRHVRVRRRVVTEPRVVEVPVWHERIEVDRVPVDAFVERVPEPRREGDVLIIPCVEEVVVVEKRLRVREELRVRVVREDRIHRETVELRRHEIDLEHYEESNIKRRGG